MRKELELTQSELAKILKVKTWITISRWENGRHVPNGYSWDMFLKLEELAGKYGVSKG